jgi:GTP pyrophosphokinase
VGYITRGRGVAIHAARCHNLRRLQVSADRLVKVEWGSSQGASYAVPLNVSFDDRPGMLAAITQTVNGEDANIRSCQMASRDRHRGAADLIIDIRGREHLSRVFGALRKIPGVTGVASGPSSFARRSEF